LKEWWRSSLENSQEGGGTTNGIVSRLALRRNAFPRGEHMREIKEYSQEKEKLEECSSLHCVGEE